MISLLFSLLSLDLPAMASEPRPIVMMRGGNYSISSPSKKDVYLSNGSVLKITDQGTQLRVSAKSLGSASINIGSKSWHFLVINKTNFEHYLKLKNLLNNMMGLSIEVKLNSCEIKGNLYRWSDWQKIFDYQRLSKFKCRFSARIDSVIFKKVERAIEALLHQNLLHSFSLKLKSRDLFYKDKSMEGEFKKVALPLGLNLKRAQNHLGARPLILVTLNIVEVNRNWQRQMGINWDQNLSASLLPKWQDTSQLNVALKLMESSGQGRMIASPRLVSESGKTSHFHAGGEIPIVTKNKHRGQQVIWKKYGIMLNIEPKADLEKNLSLKIKTEVSNIDPSTNIEGIPGFKTNRLESQFNIKSGQNIVLSGLIKAENGQGQNGIPAIMNLPIIGNLFKSQNFMNNRSELIIIVEPKVVVPNYADTN